VTYPARVDAGALLLLKKTIKCLPFDSAPISKGRINDKRGVSAFSRPIGAYTAPRVKGQLFIKAVKA
jgi:hypothetical protein